MKVKKSKVIRPINAVTGMGHYSFLKISLLLLLLLLLLSCVCVCGGQHYRLTKAYEMLSSKPEEIRIIEYVLTLFD